MKRLKYFIPVILVMLFFIYSSVSGGCVLCDNGNNDGYCVPNEYGIKNCICEWASGADDCNTLITTTAECYQMGGI